MKKIILSLLVVIIFSNTTLAEKGKRFSNFGDTNSILSLYDEIKFGGNKPDFNALMYGVAGYNLLESRGEIHNYKLTIVDFSKSANQQRFWVIDMESKNVLFNTLVAHGKNSGQEYAYNFSNTNGSYQSSLGFYLTDELYDGKHKLSLRLNGIERGFNDNARSRGVVIHGADYVSNDFIRNNGRLGRSHGCPALSNEVNGEIVQSIKEKSCLFIYYPDDYYIENSPILNQIDII